MILPPDRIEIGPSIFLPNRVIVMKYRGGHVADAFYINDTHFQWHGEVLYDAMKARFTKAPGASIT